MITDVDIRQHLWYIEIKVDVRRQMEALMKHITLSDGEWKIMKLLWNTCPLSLREITTVSQLLLLTYGRSANRKNH